jgi:hypothetical protein
MHNKALTVATMAAMGTLALTAGCLNPQTFNAALGNLYPVTPAGQPFVLVRVINDTTATFQQVPIVYDDGNDPAPAPIVIQNLTPAGHDSGILLDWPVWAVSIGSATNTLSPGIIAVFPDGTTTLVAPTASLQAGVDFTVGDALVFHVTADARSTKTLYISVGRIEAASQGDNYSRDNPFAKVAGILATPQ